MSQHSQEKNSLGFVGKTARFFLENGKISWLVIAGLFAWGGLSFFITPKQYNPDITAPAFSVSVALPGASEQEVRQTVTRVVEDAAMSIPGTDEIFSSSFAGGKSIVTVKFLVSFSQDRATTALTQKMNEVKSALPPDAGEIIVATLDPDDVPILDIGLSSPLFSEEALRAAAFTVADELKTIPGVAKTEVRGGETENFHITLDAESMRAKNIATDEALRALSGSVGNFSVSALEGSAVNTPVSIFAGAHTADELRRLVLRTDGTNVVRLGDIADAAEGPGEISRFVRVADRGGDRETVHVTLAKKKGENATTLTTDALEKLDILRTQSEFDGISLTVLRDDGKTAREEIGKLTLDLLKSIAIVGALLALFLGMRNALVASVSIPLVLLSVFGAGLLAGQTINRITLFALILSLGLLVDDAIVVVENIARFKKLFPNESPMRRIARAVDEVGGALALSTLTMALAFFPMAFVTGMMGPYMGPIPFFVPAALFASLAISITLNPFLAFVFSGKQASTTRVEKHTAVSRAFERLAAFYEKILLLLLANRRKRHFVLGGVLTAFLFSLVLPATPLVPFRMLPKADREQFYVYLDLPDTASVTETNAAARDAEIVLLRENNIERVESFVGEAPVIDFNGLFRGSSGRAFPNQATMKVDLVPTHDRTDSSETIATRARESLRVAFSPAHPDAVARIVEDPPGPPVLSTFLLKIRSEDDRARETATDDLARIAQTVSGVVDLDTTLPERTVTASYRIDTEKASLLGVAPAVAQNALVSAVSGSVVSVARQNGAAPNAHPETETVRVRFAKNNRDDASDLSLVTVRSANGSLVPLSSLVSPVDTLFDAKIDTDGRTQTASVSAEMEGRSVIYATLDMLGKLLDYTPFDGRGTIASFSPLEVVYQDPETHHRLSVSLDGEWKLTLDVFRDLGIVMGAVLLLIFFVLAVRTKSILIPALILVSVPLGLIGILPGFALLFALKGTYFTATSMIGVIALSGLSVKNAVIYLEYYETLRSSGMPLENALVRAGRIRLLPIVLTSLAAVFGSLTIVTDPVWEGLAWSLIFGLTASTILTLIVFPLLVFSAERRREKNNS